MLDKSTVDNVFTPLLKSDWSIPIYGDSVNKYIGKRIKVSTEDVVNSVGNIPSFSFLMVMFGIFTFNLVRTKEKLPCTVKLITNR